MDEADAAAVAVGVGVVPPVSAEYFLLCHCAQILKWMLSRLKPKEFGTVKQSVSELLGILMQASEKNQKMLGAAGGIDTLLTSVAPYRSR